MFERTADALDAYDQDNGSMVFCLEDMKPKAEDFGFAKTVTYIDAALGDCKILQVKNYDWGQYKVSGPARRTEAVETDVKIDRTLGHIHTIIKAHADSEVDSPQRRAARRLKKELLPRGVFPITSLKYEEQHRAVAELYERMTTTYAADVDTVGLTSQVTLLGQFNDIFGEQLNVHDLHITYDQVLEARRNAQESFAKAIITALSETLEDPAARAELLSAFYDQQRRIADYRKRRGSVPPVDPDTGEFVEDGAADDTDGPNSDDTDRPVADDPVEPTSLVEE